MLHFIRFGILRPSFLLQFTSPRTLKSQVRRHKERQEERHANEHNENRVSFDDSTSLKGRFHHNKSNLHVATDGKWLTSDYP